MKKSLRTRITYHGQEVDEVDIRGSQQMFPILSSKHDSSVLINAGEGEGSTGRRSSVTDGWGGPAT